MLQTQQQYNNSSEVLPAPPEYMLNTTRNNQQLPPQMQQHQNHNANSNAKPHYMTSSSSVGQIASSLSAQNMKMINELRQSPGVMRRQLSLINPSNHHPSSNHSQSNTHVITVFLFLWFKLFLIINQPADAFRLEILIFVDFFSILKTQIAFQSSKFQKFNKKNCLKRCENDLKLHEKFSHLDVGAE